MNKITYDELSSNKIVEKAISARKPMTDKMYDTIKIKRNGMQINFEFPPKSARDQLIEQEVKDIISGELKEKSRKIYIS
ncbi:hypothetical protein DW049_08365 [Ruminococcus sp. AF41-9]|jgi:hypothetical protein|nr:hypothetical protein DW049_08365 [Ruminococcus sp. AF41-9]